MIRRGAALLALGALAVLAPTAPAAAIAPPCEATFKAECFALESLDAELSTTQAGAHPDLSFSFAIAQDPESDKDSSGAHDAFAPVRNVRTDIPPGLIGDPGVLGAPQQCRAIELAVGECPNGSQIGIARINLYKVGGGIVEPIYMMVAPGGEAVARVGFVGFVVGRSIYADLFLRSEGDYGLSSEIVDAPTNFNLIESEVTLWGVPAAEEHDTERCTPSEQFLEKCIKSPPRPPGSRELPFITNPTRCGVELQMSVAASNWAEPERFDTKTTSFPQITGCDKLPYGPGLTIEPTNRRAGAPTGLDLTMRVPAAEGPKVLEPSQTRDIRVKLPEGMAINTSASDGLQACSEAQAHFGERVSAQCPDASKLADFEVEIPALPRRMRGAIYLRDPEPGNLFRFWALADDLGLHVKLKGQLKVDQQTGQLESTVLGIPQAPVREMKIVFKSGFRAPLINPQSCGTYASEYEFTPWSEGPPVIADSQMTISEGCDGGGFDPKLSAGSTDPTAGSTSPFVFRLTREDGEQNPASLDVALPKGLAAILAGRPRCEGIQAQTGHCPAASQIGRVIASAGAGPNPLWVPQPGKRPTAVYLSGPYRGAPLSIVAVVPAQAGPFDLGDQVVRSAISVDPTSAQGTIESDPLPQMLEGVPVRYRTLQVETNPGFTLNPTGCKRKTVQATIASAQGAIANPSSPFTATNCARLGFKPRIALQLKGGTGRGAHPAFTARVRPREGDANMEGTVVRLPRSAFLDQAHIRTICTRVQYAAGEGHGSQCPAGSIYGKARAISPILDDPLEGPVFLRSSNHNLPDMVFSLHGLIDVEAVGRIDSVRGGIRATFQEIPDAPISEVVVAMQGGKKGLIVNSTDLCKARSRARVALDAHNGREANLKPLLRPTGCKAKRSSRRAR